MTVEQVRGAYASVADLYIELFGTRQQVHADDLAFIARHLSIRRGTVLDLGCGPGHLTDYLRSLGVDATGIDLVPEFIAHAKAAHPNGRYQLGSMTSLDAEDRSVAGILAYHWPVDEFSARLERAGFTEVEREHRPSDGTQRPLATIAAVTGEAG